MKKCIVVNFGRNNSYFQYFINYSLQKLSEQVKDLGMIVYARLKFSEHLKFIKSKCFKIINLIFKNFRVRDFHFYCKLYKIYVLPSVFYGLPIYLTNRCFSRKNIKKIQNYFTKRVYKRCFSNENIPNYIDRIKSIKVI